MYSAATLPSLRRATAISSLAILAGGLLYLLFRPRTLLLFHAADALGLAALVDRLRQVASVWSLPEWVVYSLPNGLWSAAYVVLTPAVTRGYRRRTRLLLAGIIPLVGIASEAMQAVGLLRGTPDWLDVAAYALPYALYATRLLTIKHSLTI